MSAHTDLVDGLGEAFDVLSDEFLQGATITLCKASSTADTFDTVLAIDSKRFFEYSNYRKNFLLEIADDSSQLTTAMASATHVKVNNDYYVIIAEDTTAPNSTDATWKIFCDRYERRGHYSQL